MHFQCWPVTRAMPTWVRWFFITLCLCLAWGNAHAIAFTVDTDADAHDADLADGVCATTAGNCSIRAAVEQTNTLPGADTIFLFAIDEYLLTEGELVIADDLSIMGTDATIRAGATLLDENRAIRIDASEWLVCDTNNARVMTVDRTGQTVTEFIATNAGGLQIPAAIVDYEEPLSFAQQRLYVLGWGSGLHRFADRDGSHVALDIPLDLEGDFQRVGDLLVLGDRHEVLVTRQSDVGPTGSGRVLRYDRVGNLLADFLSPGEADVIWPVALVERGAGATREILVLDRTGNRVVAFDADGNFLRVAVDEFHGGVQRINEPRTMSLGPDGYLYILMSATESIARFNISVPAGTFVDNFVQPGNIDDAQDFAFGSDGNIYVANTGAANIIRYSGVTGKFIDVFMAAEAGGIGRPTCLYPRPERAAPLRAEIDRVTITGGLLDTSTEGGGAILVGKGAALLLTRSRVHRNTSRGYGGGLMVRGEAEIIDTTIELNTVVPLQSCDVLGAGEVFPNQGGGAVAVDADAQLTLTISTLAGNTAWQGGGIFNNGGDVDTLNSTISSNDAWFDGGGVWTTLNPADGFGTASIILTTITGNTSKNCGGDLGRFRTSGGVTANPVGSVFLQSSILAGNIENPLIRPGFGDDCVVGSVGGSGLHSGGGNVIGVLEDGIGACNYIPPVLFTDQTGTFAAPLDPRLGALTIFTEPTATHRPIPPLSPAIDGGASLRCTPTDQRGEPRNLDGDLDGRRVCDSGSVEVLPATDIDGVADSVEDAGPFGGDGNVDGIRDSRQPNVASLPNGNDGRYITLIASDGDWLTSVAAVPNPSPGDAPPEALFPVGHLQFRIGLTAPDREASVDIIMPSGVRPDRYYKYGRTPAMPSTAWYRFDYDGSTGAEFPFPERLRLHFVDGERGDADLIVNSAIIDPGAPGLARTFVTIDFKAAADNVINPRDKGKFWVAILSDADFDARQVNVSSITLGPAAATVFRQRQKVGDADGNGYPDLWVQFRTKDTGIACGDTEVILKAGTPGEELIVGRDAIRTVGCK